MRFIQLTFLIFSLAFNVAAEAAKKAPVVDAAELESRIARLERVLRSQGLLDLLQQVESLQQEVARLQGEIEVQNHTIEKLKNRQRDLYADMDNRVKRMETSGQTTSVVDANTPPPLETLTPTMNDVPTNETQTEPALRMETSVANNEEESTESVEAETSNETETVATASEPIQAAATTTPSADNSARAQADYQAAFKHLKEARYDQATAAFNQYLEDHPQSVYADNAQYWLGEAYYVQRQYEDAIGAYNKLLENYPESRKVSHSLLKLGYSHQELGQIPEARQKLDEVKNRFPGTTAARLADERLRSLPKEESNS